MSEKCSGPILIAERLQMESGQTTGPSAIINATIRWTNIDNNYKTMASFDGVLSFIDPDIQSRLGWQLGWLLLFIFIYQNLPHFSFFTLLGSVCWGSFMKERQEPHTVSPTMIKFSG